MELERQIKEKKIRQDKKDNNICILKTDKGEVIFVFHRNVSESKWDNLNVEETRPYRFTVEEGNEENRFILLDFKIITEQTLENIKITTESDE